MKSRIAAILLAFFFGLIGFHKFYLNDNKKGLLYLILSITGLGLIATIPLVLVDFFSLILMSDDAFNGKYNHKKTKVNSSKQFHFSKKEAIKFGFKVAKENIIFFLGVFVVWFLITIISQGIQTSLNSQKQIFASLIFTVVMWIVNSIISMGVIYITLQFVDNKKPKVKEIFYTKNLFNYILASIVRTVIIFIGFILLIVPGILFSIKLQYSDYLIVDKGKDAVDSLKGSWEMTKGVKWNLFLFGILLGLINILGFLALLLGLLVTVPLSMVANAYVYRKLLSQSHLK